MSDGRGHNPIKVCTYSEAGNGSANEDALHICNYPHATEAYLCALSDGQGGRAGGAAAAQAAVRSTLEAASSEPVKGLRQSQSWCRILSKADEAVRDDAAAGYATLIGLYVTDEGVYGASCGDSAALLFQQEQVNILTEGQHKNPPIGSGGARPVGFTAKLVPPWKLLVASDGIWKYAGWDVVISLMKTLSGESLMSALHDAAALPNGKLQDDTSIILLEQ